MARGLRLVAALSIAWTTVGGAQAAPRGSWSQHGRAAGVGYRRRAFPYHARHGRGWRTGRRVVVPRAGVSLPQLRTELTRLESGLGTHVQRIEKAVSRPPAPRPIVVAAPPAAVPLGLPPGPTAAAALLLSAITALAGFVLGQRWAGTRRHRDAETRGRGDATMSGGSLSASPCLRVPASREWLQLRQRLDETQRRLSAVRARIRQLERRA